MGELEVVFYTGSIPSLQEFQRKLGKGKNVLCLDIVKYQVGLASYPGHMWPGYEATGWPYALYVVCIYLIKKQQVDMSTVQRMVMKILIGNIDLQTLFPKP